MPPRKKAVAVPVTPPLDGLSIALSGTPPDGHTQGSIEKDFITVLGASLSKSVSSSTTHLVTTEEDFKKPSAKAKSALSKGIHIISYAWLKDCLQQKSHINEDVYSLVASSQPQQSQTNGSRKRTAAQKDSDDGVDVDDSAPQAKKKGKTGKGEAKELKEAKEAKEAKEEAKEEVKEREPKVADGQIAKSLDVKIPLDEGADRELPQYDVYIDDDGVIYDAALNQTNASNNNNKFYRLQILRSASGSFLVWARWGRVGEYGQAKKQPVDSLEEALRNFQSKFKSKSGLAWDNRNDAPKPGKYAFIEKSYEPDSEDEDEEKDDDGKVKVEEGKAEAQQRDEPQSKLEKPIQDLMQLIFNQQYFANAMSDLNYDSAKLPLGKLSKATISRGFQALKDLSALLDDPTLATSQYNTSFPRATEHLSNLFFTIIPHAFGRNRPPIIQTETMLKKEIELLESLSDMKDALQLMKAERKSEINELDRRFLGLGLKEMTPLSQTSTEFQLLSDYLMDTRGATHGVNYKISDIFRIERDGEFGRFDQAYKNPQNRRLLWHGSRCTNFGGILSQGLRIAPPEAPVSGYGIYLADMSSKSANYCCSYSSNGHALLLLCEAELGDPMQNLTHACYNAGEDAKAKGMLSTWGQGETGPLKWKDAECVHPSLKGVKMPDTTVKPGPTGVPGAYLQYNEYICYDVSQVRLRYLLRVKM
ncbi:poly polymerase catalytic domain-containing protein [Xylariaceae sp. FL0594]|nr:poly polymerase catalytic domain-containing protein [Xylariaceae sp. FL0594]